MAEKRENSSDKIYIGDISGLIGTPSSTLRFYETHDIVSPVKDGDNNYRLFTPAQSCRILMTRLYRSFGLSLGDISALLRSDSPECNFESLEEKETDIELEIKRLSAIRDELIAYNRQCRTAERLIGKVEKGSCESWLRIENIIDGSIIHNNRIDRVVKRWMGYLPFAHYSLKIDYQPENNGGEVFRDWGFAIDRNFADSVGETAKPPVTEYPASECLYTGYKRNSPHDFTIEEIKELVNILRTDGKDAPGPIFGRFLSVHGKEEEAEYLYLIFKPIKK